jgi:hypothetical protein
MYPRVPWELVTDPTFWKPLITDPTFWKPMSEVKRTALEWRKSVHCVHSVARAYQELSVTVQFTQCAQAGIMFLQSVMVASVKVCINGWLSSRNTVHSCSRHGVVAARLPTGTARQRYTYFKNIYCVGSTFLASVTVDVFGTDIRRSVARAQCSFFQQLTSSPTQQLLSNYTK